MAVGVGGQGFLGIAIETTPGTYVAPTTYVPILSESLAYTEDRYLSPAIRKATIVNDVRQSFYHVEGDVEMEVDSSTFVYFMHACRVSVNKVGASAPFTYTFTPSGGASVGPNGNNATVKTLSITIVRNLQVFKYVGCVVGSWNVRVENGVLLTTLSIQGLGEVSVNTDSPPTPTFTTPSLYGASTHTISTAAVVNPPTTPTWTAQTNFETFQFAVNDNGAAQNRIQSTRQAAFVSFGETEGTISGTRDFEVRSDYDNFVASSVAAFQLKSVNSVNDSVQFDAYRGVYTAFPITLPGMGDLVTVAAEARMLQNGTRSYDVVVVTGTNIS